MYLQILKWNVLSVIVGIALGVHAGNALIVRLHGILCQSLADLAFQKMCFDGSNQESGRR